MRCHAHGQSHHGRKWNNCKKLKGWNQGCHKTHGHCKSFANSSDAKILMHKKKMHHHHHGDFHKLYHPCQHPFYGCLGRDCGYHAHHAHHHCRHGYNHISSTQIEGSANAQASQSCTCSHNQDETCHGNKNMADKAVNTSSTSTQTENEENNQESP